MSSATVAGAIRNVGVYLIGVAIAVAGALGLSGAIELHVPVSALLFAAGLALVIVVHEYFGGPIRQ